MPHTWSITKDIYGLCHICQAAVFMDQVGSANPLIPVPSRFQSALHSYADVPFLPELRTGRMKANRETTSLDRLPELRLTRK